MRTAIAARAPIACATAAFTRYAVSDRASATRHDAVCAAEAAKLHAQAASSGSSAQSLASSGSASGGAAVEPRQVRYVGRKPSAAPATGLTELHRLELEELLRDAMR